MYVVVGALESGVNINFGDFGMLCLPRQNFNMTIASLDYDRL